MSASIVDLIWAHVDASRPEHKNCHTGPLSRVFIVVLLGREVGIIYDKSHDLLLAACAAPESLAVVSYLLLYVVRIVMRRVSIPGDLRMQDCEKERAFG